MIKVNDKVNKIVEDITSGQDKYFGMGHFHISNMTDYTLMSSTIEDMINVYDINEVQAADIIQALTHNQPADEPGMAKLPKGSPGNKAL